MAIVASGVASTGAKWIIRDDCYINNTPEENERRRRHACDIAYRILCQYAREQSEREKNNVSDDLRCQAQS